MSVAWELLATTTATATAKATVDNNILIEAIHFFIRQEPLTNSSGEFAANMRQRERERTRPNKKLLNCHNNYSYNNLT